MRPPPTRRAAATILLLSQLLWGCSLIPELPQPQAGLPAQYRPALPGAGTPIDSSSSAAALGWRQMFPDPRLQQLITLALEHNHDLRLALLQVAQFQAQYDIAGSARLPSLEAGLSASRQRSSADAETKTGISDSRSAALGITAFEVDLFGRVGALSEAAFARYLASEHGLRAARISLIGAVAEAYFAERLAEEQLRLTELTLEDWRQSLELARKLKLAQQNSGLDVAQAEGQVATAEADLESRRRALAQARHGLALLTGTPQPPELPPPLALDARPVLTQLPAGLPSSLLLQRPDLLQAEQSLLAANADIGAARAAFFPRLLLTLSVGAISPSFGSLFQGDHRTWAFTPQITQPIFTAGRLRAELRLAELRRTAAVVEYERAIQGAFREVQDGLAGSATFGRQIEAQEKTVASAERRRELSTLRYRAGLDSRLELLDAQRQAYGARLALLELRREEIRNAIGLYKALGGGGEQD
ncbi:efflux transporter outer membrane subunit [Azovibrio restrictus]|uniref:efflux transporter outer membrane subunit n=1 Tax=Azovibrio restrictus TaxID=146938 RepID=UPI0026ECBA04|nr:efflux transporter outer membrane subunit [Azovibrio restrictus]MDD3481359.1 efflux transporter outer membrane subunit [Azovibrio restrictus]